MTSKAQRFAEFESRASLVQAKIEKRFPNEVLRLMDSQIQAACRADTPPKVLHWLRKAASTIGDAAAPISACSSGCSACCHVPVMLLASEAHVIGKEIGKKPADVPTERRNQPPPAWQGADYPCPFLKSGNCSIYEFRPLPCRTLYNLDRDALLCQHEEGPNLVPYLNAQEFSVAAVTALARSEFDYVAELRDFFSFA